LHEKWPLTSLEGGGEEDMFCKVCRKALTLWTYGFMNLIVWVYELQILGFGLFSV